MNGPDYTKRKGLRERDNFNLICFLKNDRKYVSFGELRRFDVSRRQKQLEEFRSSFHFFRKKREGQEIQAVLTICGLNFKRIVCR